MKSEQKENARHEAGRGPKPLARFEGTSRSTGKGRSAVLIILHYLARKGKWLLCEMAAIGCAGAALWFFAAPILRPQDALALWLLAGVAGWLAREAHRAAGRCRAWEQ